jgi:hypothetical protein
VDTVVVDPESDGVLAASTLVVVADAVDALGDAEPPDGDETDVASLLVAAVFFGSPFLEAAAKATAASAAIAGAAESPLLPTATGAVRVATKTGGGGGFIPPTIFENVWSIPLPPSAIGSGGRGGRGSSPATSIACGRSPVWSGMTLPDSEKERIIFPGP